MVYNQIHSIQYTYTGKQYTLKKKIYTWQNATWIVYLKSMLTPYSSIECFFHITDFLCRSLSFSFYVYESVITKLILVRFSSSSTTTTNEQNKTYIHIQGESEVTFPTYTLRTNFGNLVLNPPTIYGNYDLIFGRYRKAHKI